MGDMVSAIQTEIELQREYLSGQPITTIYLGGGTPRLLPAETIEDLVQHLEKHFQLDTNVEITLEANPDDLSSSYLNNLRSIGINRLSIGIQSFNNSVLQWMNRAHDQNQAIRSFEQARNAGFDNLSLDLIYGIPLTSYSFEQDLGQALQLAPDHISGYHLTIEPGTLFGHQLKKGLLTEVSEQTAAENFQLAMTELKNHGFIHYEISNFCRPGKESKHNLGYWSGDSYLGVGPSAHSFNGDHRQYNISNNGRYLRSIQAGKIPCTREILTPEQRINEMIMLGIRTSDGVKLQLQAGNLNWNIATQSQDYLEQLLSTQLARVQKNRLLLTDQGKLLADKIAEDLFLATD